MLEQEKEHGGGILADEMGMGKVRLAGSLDRYIIFSVLVAKQVH